MTTQDNKKLISQELTKNSKFNKVEFGEQQFKATNRGHGLYVQTIGQDVLIDLRFSSERPFWGHTHPLITQHNYKMLNQKQIISHYSVPITEFTRMIETFQKVHFTQLISDDFEITYYNIVVTIDEKILEYDYHEVITKVKNFISKNPKTLFWVFEKDIALLSDSSLFLFQWSKNGLPANVHHCAFFHFIGSVYLISNHLFSEDNNIQLFLAMNHYFSDVISYNISGKNKIDYKIIDDYISQNMHDLSISRISRYLVINNKPNVLRFNQNGILLTDMFNDKTILSIPLSCTKDELLDTLDRIRISLNE